jgi:hypothetical protein
MEGFPFINFPETGELNRDLISQRSVRNNNDFAAVGGLIAWRAAISAI